MKKLLVLLTLTSILFLSGAVDLNQAEEAHLGTPVLMPERPAKFDRADPASAAMTQTFLPFVWRPPEQAPWVDTQNKDAVRQFYLNVYLASENVPSGWTGSHNPCKVGTTTAAFREAVLKRINYFREMSGIPAVTGFLTDYNRKAQAAALMMSANGALSHDPPSNWKCYSADGDEGAGSSNLYLGVYGPAAISGYVYDPGSGNYPVGHRRWILYPQTQYMGTGDIPPVSGYWSANALWVFDLDNMWGPRPATRDEFVAWPPKGYVPRQVVYPRWSFSYPGANFSSTSVAVTRGGKPVSVSVSPVVNGYGENTIVWELGESLPSGEVVYTVSLQNVKIDSVNRNFSYQVMIFDPTK